MIIEKAFERTWKDESCMAWKDKDEPQTNGGCGKPMTFGDKIRAMTDEELAEMLANVANQGGGSCAPGCYDCSKRDTCKEAWFEWLQQEVDNG